MLFYVSIADNHSGKFIGATFVNGETQEAAGAAAAALVPGRCIEMACIPVPAGGPPIPSIGKLLSFEDLHAAFDDVQHVRI